MEKEVKTETKVNSYLTFKIGDEVFGAHVDMVLNILELQEITKIPKSPNYMKGVINLRGKVLPVIDTRIKFGMSPTEFTDSTCIIAMDLKMNNEIVHIGALVDSVDAVLELSNQIIDPAPKIGVAFNYDFITGVAKVNDRFIMILDLIKLFTGDEIADIKEIQSIKTKS